MDEEPIFITIWATGQKIRTTLIRMQWLTLHQEYLLSRECRYPQPKAKAVIMSIYYPKDLSSGKQVILLIFSGKERLLKASWRMFCIQKTGSWDEFEDSCHQ